MRLGAPPLLHSSKGKLNADPFALRTCPGTEYRGTVIGGNKGGKRRGRVRVRVHVHCTSRPCHPVVGG
jgi:hypothetical protein